MKKRLLPIILVLLLILLVTILYLRSLHSPSTKETLDNNRGNSTTNLPNPASANCIEKGGKLEMRNNPKGQYGVCVFLDNRQCEEWALLRGTCPVGGVKVTGYIKESEAYCAITGGVVEGLGTDTPMCKRADGTLCTAEANFNGDCPDPNLPNPSSGNVEAK